MELCVKAYVKRPDSEFEAITLTSTEQMKEIIGTLGKRSLQIHTAKGFSVYANPDADGNCVGHTVDLSGSLCFWAGTYIVAKYKGKSLVDMDEYDLSMFETMVLDKSVAEDNKGTFASECVINVDALKASMEARENGK